MKMRKIAGLLLPLGLLLFSPHSYSQAELAARVVDVIGRVEVVRADGSREVLQRRDEIRVGDDIETAADGTVQLRFIDSAIVSLSCDSKLSINAYQYRQGSGDRVELALHAGSLRTIAGKIASEEYRLQIADSVVHSGGGDFEITLAEDGTQFFGVYNGVMTIAHAQIESKLGRGANADFAKVERGSSFEELSQQPPLLGNTALVFASNPQLTGSRGCPS